MRLSDAGLQMLERGFPMNECTLWGLPRNHSLGFKVTLGPLHSCQPGRPLGRIARLTATLNHPVVLQGVPGKTTDLQICLGPQGESRRPLL